MKKFSLLIMPLMAISFLASCNNGGNTPVQTFTVVWQNDDGTVLETDYNVPYGSKPKYDGPKPTKPDTEKYRYTFVGWDKDTTKDIIEDTTFTATYSAEVFKHTVTFYDNDRQTVLDKHEVEHGATPQYKGAYPVRVDDSYYYTFDGWDRELEPITTDTSYYAKPRRPIPIEGISAYIKLVIPESSIDRKFDFTYTTEEGTGIEVSWGDDTNTNGTSSHTYAEPGIYDVTIKNATMIDTYATTGKEYIKEIYLGNSINAMHTSSFADSSNLAAVTIDANIKSISGNAFSRCGSLSFVNIHSEQITGIDYNAFSDCSSLVSVNMPETVTSFGSRAFSSCYSLKDISLPNSLTKIDDRCFYRCTSLESINVPKEVNSIGQNPFSECSSLSEIVVDSDNTIFDSRDNCNAIIKTTSNELIVGCKASTIPSSVVSIGEAAFKCCYYLSSITFGEGLKSIGDEAFAGCESITSIEFPNTVTEIGDEAFADCFYLSNVTLNEGLKTIGTSAFSNCAIKSIEIPSTVDSIEETVFAGCDYLTSIKVAEGNTTYDSRDNCNAIIEIKTGTLIAGCLKTVIPTTTDVVAIGEYAFNSCMLTSITIPSNITRIDDGAFTHCYYLESVTFNEGLKTIGAFAFQDCVSLTKLTLPNGLASIERYAFYDCVYLEEINLPDSIETIGFDAFSSCYSLTKIVLPKSLKRIDSFTFSNCYYLESVEIPNGVLTIGDSAFSHCYSLTSIAIPNSVTSIEEEVFYNCYYLESVDLTGFINPNAIPECAANVFADCSYSLKLKVASEEMADAFIAKGGGWAIGKQYYDWPK